MDIDRLENTLLDHCYNMTILKTDAEQKKKDSVIDSLVAAVIRLKLPIEELIDCINDVNNDDVVNLDFFDNGGNLYNYINPKWTNFAKALYRQRCVGLGTPNAASGEGELMFIFLSHHITKPTKGDLKIRERKIELKGEKTRVMGKITGKEFRRRTLTLPEKYTITPNKSYKTNLDCVEIEKKKHRDYWNDELSDFSTTTKKEFINDYLKCIDNKDHNVDFVDLELLPKEIVKILYSEMVSDRNFDEFIILGDGTNAKVLSNDVEKFNEKVDNGTIEIKSDFFRVNQNRNIGWYID